MIFYYFNSILAFTTKFVFVIIILKQPTKLNKLKTSQTWMHPCSHAFITCNVRSLCQCPVQLGVPTISASSK